MWLISVDLPAFGPPEHGDAQGLGEIEFAAVLFFAQDQRLGLVLLVRVEARGGGQDFDQRVVEFAQALAMLGGERDRLAKAETEHLVDAGLPGRAFRLVGDEDDRLVGAAHRLREMLVGVGEPGARVDHEQDRVAIDERRFRLRAHAPGERFRIALFKTGGVDDGEGEVRDPAFALAAVARDARLVVDERQPAADQPVEQRRLADIRPADDRDFGAHVVPARRRRRRSISPRADRFEAIRPSQRLAACRSLADTSGSPSTRSNCFEASS